MFASCFVLTGVLCWIFCWYACFVIVCVACLLLFLCLGAGLCWFAGRGKRWEKWWWLTILYIYKHITCQNTTEHNITWHYITLRYITYMIDHPEPVICHSRTIEQTIILKHAETLHMICNSLKRNRIPWGRKCREPFLQINLLQRLSEGIDMCWWGVEPSEVEPPGWYGAISMPFGNRCGICGGICGICGIAFLKTPGGMMWYGSLILFWCRRIQPIFAIR